LRLLPLPTVSGSSLFIWDEDDIPANNYAALDGGGRTLSQYGGEK
jgi:hypothetical protein